MFEQVWKTEADFQISKSSFSHTAWIYTSKSDFPVRFHPTSDLFTVIRAAHVRNIAVECVSKEKHGRQNEILQETNSRLLVTQIYLKVINKQYRITFTKASVPSLFMSLKLSFSQVIAFLNEPRSSDPRNRKSCVWYVLFREERKLVYIPLFGFTPLAIIHK